MCWGGTQPETVVIQIIITQETNLIEKPILFGLVLSKSTVDSLGQQMIHHLPNDITTISHIYGKITEKWPNKKIFAWADSDGAAEIVKKTTKYWEENMQIIVCLYCNELTMLSPQFPLSSR